jgi:two-component system LytT family response regulator
VRKADFSKLPDYKNMKYKAIIVDDENLAREMLQDMVALVNPEIHVVALCEDIPEAVKAINKHRPDIVFLDVDMPRYKGIDIVEFFEEIDFDIVFTTAHQQYAIDAIKMNAFDYLLKPIDIQDLRTTIDKFVKKKVFSADLDVKQKGKLLVNTMQVVHFIDLDKIIYFRADGAYTEIVCADTKILSSKNLKYYEEYFSDNHSFVRCHKSYIVNRNKIVSINKVKQDIMLENGDNIHLAIDKLDMLMNP